MNHPRLPTVPAMIREHIEGLPAGEPFGTSALLGFGSRAAVDQALSRLARAGEIERVARGIYMRPRVSPYVGRVAPQPAAVVRAIAEQRGETVQVHGAEAARQFGFSTQVPARPVFLTTGPSRKLQLGNLPITMRHASPKKLAYAGRPAGLALAALRYLGAEQVDEQHLEALERQLPAEEFETLRTAWGVMPGWLVDRFHRYEATKTHA